jgi:hypothetical protein
MMWLCCSFVVKAITALKVIIFSLQPGNGLWTSVESFFMSDVYQSCASIALPTNVSHIVPVRLVIHAISVD